MAYIKTPRAWMHIYSVITVIFICVTVTSLYLYYCLCSHPAYDRLNIVDSTTCILWHLLAFQKSNMDPRTFRVPIQCALCDRVLYTLCDMSRHCSTHVPSPTPPTAAVLPRSQPASQPTPVLSASSPTAAVAISDSASRDQLLRDIDVPSTGRTAC